MKTIKLSDRFNIWRGKYTGSFSKETFLKHIKINNELANHTNNNSVWIEINTPCFSDINKFIRDQLKIIDGRDAINYAEHHWVYTQTKGFDLTWMHQHILVHPQGRSNILTDYTFTFYIQTPKDISGDEGHIVFETEDKQRHKFLPQEGDIFIFPADIRHSAIPTPNSDTDRIVYAGSVCIDVANQIKTTRSAI